MSERVRFVPVDKTELERIGGFAEEDMAFWDPYNAATYDPPSFDKGGHKERSIVHSPQHERHWKNK
ncbi:hypothetical protein KAZ66_04955 [Candidatus Woesebacteria bacterium]|nr:hypothetical protein [Candidatus Woesebacteria bacterium]